MPSYAAKRFAVIALPLMISLAPSFASANCNEDSLGFHDALTDIQIDTNTLNEEQRSALRGPNAFNEVMPDLLKDAASAASEEVIQTVLESRQQLLDGLGGERPEDLGLPAYPAFEDARDAFLCAMAELRANRIMYSDDRAKYSRLEDAFHRLMIITIRSEDDIRDRLETIRNAEASGALQTYAHNYSQVDKFFGKLRASTIQDIIIADDDMLDAYINFAVREINNPDSELNRGGLGEVLADLVAYNHDYVPEFLDYIEQDDFAFNYLLDRFIQNTDTSEFNDEIIALLTDKAENSDNATIQYLANNRLSRFNAQTEELAPPERDFYR